MNNCDAQVEVRPGFPAEIWSTVNPQTVAAKWIAPHWASRVVFESANSVTTISLLILRSTA